MQYVAASLASEVVSFEQSADAVDMLARITRRIAQQVLAGLPCLASCELGGAGDGHTFVARLGFMPADTVGALIDVSVRTYLAADAENLAIARAAALASIGPPSASKADELIAGSSKGTRFMGLVLYGTPVVTPDPPGPVVPPVPLGLAGAFGILGGTPDVNSTGATAVTGDVGVWPAASIIGFPPGTLTGAQHAGDLAAQLAQSDLTVAYLNAAARGPATPIVADTLPNGSLSPGIYSGGALNLPAGILTLDAGGDPNAVWVFQAASTLNFANGTSVALANGAQAKNVFWQVGSSATLGTTVVVQGSIMALTSITLNNGATLNGRALARNGTVSCNANPITVPV